jgi:predicted Fe-Mo cluster-binding NifX family protein
MKVAFPTNNKKTIANHIGLAKGFLIVDTNTGEKFYIQNPVIATIQEENINLKDLPEGQRGLGTGRVIPPLLKEAGVDALVARDFGEGMIMNLQRMGIAPIETQIKEIEEFLENFDEKEVDINYEFTPRYGGYGFGRRFGYGRGYRCGYARGYKRGFGHRFRGL